MQESEHGVVYTKRWVVEIILDMVGYRSGTGLAQKKIVEPSCGCGAFLAAIASVDDDMAFCDVLAQCLETEE